MALNSLGLGFVFTARNLASGAISGLNSQFQTLDGTVKRTKADFGRNMVAIGAGMATMGAGVGLLAGQFKLASYAGDFEQGLAGVGAVSKATAAEMRLLESAAIDAGIATQFSPKEAVDGLTSLATAGQSAQDATKTLVPVLDLAAGSLGQLGVAQAAEAVVGTLNSYQIAAKDAGVVTDKLLRITQLTNFQARDFEAGLSKAAAAGATFGQSLEDTLIVVGQLRNANIDASSASTAYREAVRRMASDQNAQQAITKLGVDVFDRQTGATRSVIEVMQDMITKMGNVSDEEKNATIARAFGARGLLAYNAVMKTTATKVLPDGTKQTLKGAEAIAYLRGELKGASGTAAEFREKLLDTFAGQMTLMKGSVQTFATVVGKDMIKMTRPAVEKLISLTNTLITRWKDMSPATKETIGAVVRIAGVALAAAGALTVLGAVAPMLAAGLRTVLTAGRAIGLVFGALSAPVLAVVALAGTLYMAYRENLGGFADWINGWVEKVKLTWGALVQFFRDGHFSGAVMEDLGKAENEGVLGFVTGVVMLVHRVSAAWDGFVAVMTAGWERIKPGIQAFGEALGKLWDALVRLVGAVFNFDAVFTSSSASWREAGAAIADGLITVFNIVMDVINSAVTLVTDAVDGMSLAFGVLGNPLDNLKAAFLVVWDAVTRVFEAFGATTEAGGGLMDVLRFLAKWAGTTLGVAIKMLAVAFEGVAHVIAFVVDLVASLVKGFLWFGRAVGEGLGWWYEFFTQTLPDAFAKFGEFLYSLLVEPVVAVVNAIWGALKTIVNKIMGFVAEIVQALPDWAVPDWLSDWAGAQLAGGGDEEAVSSAAMRAKFAPRADQAAADEAGRQEAVAAQKGHVSDMLAAFEASMATGKGARNEISVNVDGRTVAKVVAEHSRDGELRDLRQPALDYGG